MADSQESSPEPILLKSALSNSNHSSSAEDIRTEPSDQAHLATPLQQSFPSSPLTSEVETCSNEASSTQRDYKKVETRGRGMSRSSSVPAAMNTTAKKTVNSTSSVRHMTCFWWKEKGHCSKSSDDCAYAHYDTGLYTRAPQHLFPGEKALAGRKLERAQRNLAVQYVHGSSGSLVSLAGSRHGSRPVTPNFDTSASREMNEFQMSNGPSRAAHRQFLYASEAERVPTPSPTEVEFHRLGHDNELLKNLVEQNSKEKAILIGTIESLQANSKSLNAELEGLRLAQEQLLAEREGLHTRLAELDHRQQIQMPIRSASHPFGPIGRARVNTETRYLGGLLDNE